MDVGKSLHKHRLCAGGNISEATGFDHLNATAAEDQEVKRFQVFNLIFSTEKHIHRHYFPAPSLHLHNDRKAIARLTYVTSGS